MDGDFVGGTVRIVAGLSVTEKKLDGIHVGDQMKKETCLDGVHLASYAGGCLVADKHGDELDLCTDNTARNDKLAGLHGDYAVSVIRDEGVVAVALPCTSYGAAPFVDPCHPCWNGVSCDRHPPFVRHSPQQCWSLQNCASTSESPPRYLVPRSVGS